MRRHLLAPALAFTALASATAAQAQQKACIEPADMTDAVIYAMPVAYDAARTACGDRFAASGFMARKGEAWAASFRDQQDKAWPGALRVLKTFMADDAAAKGAGGDDMGAIISALPEDALRPFVEAMVGQMIAKEIKPDSCGTIERAVELLSPLPGENIGGLVAFILEMDKKGKQPLCEAPAAMAKVSRAMPLSLLPEDIAELAARVVAENADAGRKVATAESCTGGLVAGAITEIAGSSVVLDRGFVTYSNEAKMEMLGVSSDIIEAFGAVSIACAWAMAKGALDRSKADVAVAISGVAGPGGGSPQKPVGTVVFARVVRGETGEPEGELRFFDGGEGPDGRAEIRRQATICALELLLP